MSADITFASKILPLPSATYNLFPIYQLTYVVPCRFVILLSVHLLSYFWNYKLGIFCANLVSKCPDDTTVIGLITDNNEMACSLFSSYINWITFHTKRITGYSNLNYYPPIYLWVLPSTHHVISQKPTCLWWNWLWMRMFLPLMVFQSQLTLTRPADKGWNLECFSEVINETGHTFTFLAGVIISSKVNNFWPSSYGVNMMHPR